MVDWNEVLLRIENIPPLSASATKLLNLMNDPAHTVEDVRKVVEVDPGLTAHVLRVVNSAKFGLSQKVTSLERAISYLGDKMVFGIALATCSGKIYGNALTGYGGEKGRLWRHSLRSAIAARELSKFAKTPVSADIAFTGGLLHDIGKAVLSEFMEGWTEEILKHVDQMVVKDFLVVEQKVLGTNHCLVGLTLARHWNLPKVLQEVIACYHRPSAASEENRPLVYIVHLADFLSMMGGSGTGADALLYPLDDNYTRYVEIDSRELEKLILRVTVEYQKTADALFSENGEETA